MTTAQLDTFLKAYFTYRTFPERLEHVAGQM